jgi:hypothetical protein
MRSHSHRPLAAFAGAVALALVGHGCGDFTGACTLELRVHLAPSDTTVAVGDTFEPVVRLSTCGGSKQLRDAFSLETEDPAVATVDPATGRITAIAAGETRVTVNGERYGRVGAIRVAVVP